MGSAVRRAMGSAVRRAMGSAVMGSGHRMQWEGSWSSGADLEHARGGAGGLEEGGVLVERPEGELDGIALRQRVFDLV